MNDLTKIVQDPKLSNWVLERIDLAKSAEIAIEKRRQQLRKEKNNLFEIEILGEIEERTARTFSKSDIQRLLEIQTELQIIDNLMIMTQREFEKMGHKIKTVIVAGKETREIEI